MKKNRLWSTLCMLKFVIWISVVSGDSTVEHSVPCQRTTNDGTWDCNCNFKQWPMVLPPVPNHVEHVRIRQCIQLRVPADTFSQAVIVRSVIVTEIDELVLENSSFLFGERNSERSIMVSFTNVHIPNLVSHSIHGNLDELQFDSCRIDRMHAFAIMPTRAIRILTIQQTRIAAMDRHVFKKFMVAFFTIRQSSFESAVPSTMVKDVAVSEHLVITESNFTMILPNAFQFDDVNSFDFTKNHIGAVNGSSFHMRVSNQVRVSGNTIGDLSSTSFLAITSTYPTRPQENLHFQPPEFMFADNRIDLSEHPFGLRFDSNSFAVVISKLSVITPISCATLDDRLGPDNTFLRTYGDSVYFLMNDAPTAQLDEENRAMVAYSFLVDRKCVADQTVLIIVASTSLVVIVLLVVLVVVCLLCRRRRAAIERMTMVQPEPKTYRETQIVIQIENAGLLKTDL